MKYKCHCCGYYTLSEKPNGSYEICPVCFWEDDIVQLNDPDYRGGANKVSLNQARKNYIEFGVCEIEMKKYVREPNDDEITVKEDIVLAHKYCSNNKPMLLNDNLCGCFYCLEIFNPNKITNWIEDTNGTALCPFCGIDSIIGKYSGYPITKVFLRKMNEHWF